MTFLLVTGGGGGLLRFFLAGMGLSGGGCLGPVLDPLGPFSYGEKPPLFSSSLFLPTGGGMLARL